MVIQKAIGVSADRIKGDISQIQKAGKPDNDIQPQPQHDVHERRDHDIGLIGIHHKRKDHHKTDAGNKSRNGVSAI